MAAAYERIMENDSPQTDYFKKSRPRRLSSIIDARKVSFSVAENFDSYKQAEILYNNILKFHPVKGCSYCVSLDDFASPFLNWNVSHLLRPCIKLSNSAMQARTVALLGIPSTPVGTFLQSLGMNSELAGFDKTSVIMQSASAITNLLQSSLANLENTFPRIFAQSQVHLVGSATDYTLLTSLDPCLDFVLTLPSLIHEMGLCLCNVDDVTAGGCLISYPNYSQSLEDEGAKISGTASAMSSTHQAYVCCIHELFLNAVQACINTTNAQWRIEQFFLEAGQDPSGCYMTLGQIQSGRCKSLRMELVEKSDFQPKVKEKVKIFLTFAVPLVLEADVRLSGFLLLAFSQFVMLDLGVEESKHILANCMSENAPSLLCLRIAKFFAKLTQTFEYAVQTITKLNKETNATLQDVSSSSKLTRSHSRVLRGLLRRQLEILDEFVEDGFIGSNLIKEICLLLTDEKVRLEIFSESRFPLTVLHCEEWPTASRHLLAYMKILFVNKSPTAAKTLTILLDKLCQLHAVTTNEHKTIESSQQTILQEICDLIDFQLSDELKEKETVVSLSENLTVLKIESNSEVLELCKSKSWQKRREVNFS